MKHCLGVGIPTSTWAICDPASPLVVVVFFFATGEASSQGELMACGPGERQERAMVSQGVCNGGRGTKFNETTMSAGGFRWFQRFVGNFVDPEKNVCKCK